MNSPTTSTEATQFMIRALRRATELHRRGQASDIGMDFDDVQAALLPIPPTDEYSGELALSFYDSWGDCARHEWKYYRGIEREDWPRLAEEIITSLESGTRVQHPILTKWFAPRPPVLHRLFAWLTGRGPAA